MSGDAGGSSVGRASREPGVLPHGPADRPRGQLGAVSPIGAGELQRWASRVVARHPLVGFAAGVVRPEGLVALHTHGAADLDSGRPFDGDTVFRIASITKTFTAIAVMQLWERGLVDLDAPARRFLRSFRLVPVSNRFVEPTVRHLLTHTAGLPEVARLTGVVRPDFGESAPAGRRLPSLPEFYRGALRVGAPPGARFVYGNHSYAALGQIVEDVSGVPFPTYLRTEIFSPLGMDASDLLRTAAVDARLATGYRIGSRGPRAVDDREMITAGAASVYSTAHDMARYLSALLGGGSNQHGRVLQATTLATMFEAHHLPDRRLPGFGLGFYRADLGGHRAVEHHGVHPGFDSHLGACPDDGVGVMAFITGARQAMLWLGAESSSLLRVLLGVPEDAVRVDVPQSPEVWDDMRGWYRLDAGLLDVRLREALGAGVEVVIRDGRPALRFLGPLFFRPLALHPDDPDDPLLFRVDLSQFGGGTFRVAFSRDEGGRVAALHLDLMPLTLAKQPAATNPRRWAEAGVGAGLIGATVAVARRRRGWPPG